MRRLLTALILLATTFLWTTSAMAQGTLPTVSPGGSVDLSNATQCAPGTQASVFITPAGEGPIRLGSALTDQSGHFENSFNVPTVLANGPATISVDCGMDNNEVLLYNVTIGAAASSGGIPSPLMIGAPVALLAGGAFFALQKKNGSPKNADAGGGSGDGLPSPYANRDQSADPADFDPAAFTAATNPDGSAEAGMAGAEPQITQPAPPASDASSSGAPPAFGEMQGEENAPPPAPVSDDPLADLMPPPAAPESPAPAPFAAPEQMAPFTPEPVSMDTSEPMGWQPPASAPDAYETTQAIAPPLEAAPIEPASFEPAPVEAAPVAPAPFEAAPVEPAPVAEETTEDEDSTDYWVWDVTTPQGQRKRIAAVTEQAFHLHELTEDDFVAKLQNISDFGPDTALADSFYRFKLADITSAERMGDELIIRAGTPEAPQTVNIELGDEALAVTDMLQQRLGPIPSSETSAPAPMAAIAAPVDAPEQRGTFAMPAADPAPIPQPAPQPAAATPEPGPFAMPAAHPQPATATPEPGPFAMPAAEAAADQQGFVVDAPPPFAPPPSSFAEAIPMGAAEDSEHPVVESAEAGSGPIAMGPAS